MVEVYNYLDYRRFLKDWFDAKKDAQPRYSHRAFARQAGQRSPSLLLSVMEGRRNLTAATTEAFIRALSLGAKDAAFFTLLVQLDQAKTPEIRNQAWRRIAATRRFLEARQVEGAGMAYLSHWFIPATRELAMRPDFCAEAAWVARTLRPCISLAQAQHALDTLIDLGHLVVTASGKAKLVETTIATPHEIADLAVHNYHNGMIDRAREALVAVPAEERHYLGVTIGVPEELVAVLKTELNAFQSRVLDLCDGAESTRTQVYQLNLNLFPLSDRMGE